MPETHERLAQGTHFALCLYCLLRLYYFQNGQYGNSWNIGNQNRFEKWIYRLLTSKLILTYFSFSLFCSCRWCNLAVDTSIHDDSFWFGTVSTSGSFWKYSRLTIKKEDIYFLWSLYLRAVTKYRDFNNFCFLRLLTNFSSGMEYRVKSSMKFDSRSLSSMASGKWSWFLVLRIRCSCINTDSFSLITSRKTSET